MNLYIGDVMVVNRLWALYCWNSSNQVFLACSLYVPDLPTDNLKDSFNTLKKDIESKINTPANTPPQDDKTNNPGDTNPPA